MLEPHMINFVELASLGWKNYFHLCLASLSSQARLWLDSIMWVSFGFTS